MLGRRKFLLLGAIIMTLSVVTLSALTEPFQNTENYKSCTNVKVPEILEPCFNESADHLQNMSPFNHTHLGLLNQSQSFDRKQIKESIFHLNCTSLMKKPILVSNYPVAIRYTCFFALMLFVIGYAIGYGPGKFLCNK